MATILTTRGEQRVYNVGQCLVGEGIVSITLTTKDTAHPKFLEWFIEDVATRMSPITRQQGE